MNLMIPIEPITFFVQKIKYFLTHVTIIVAPGRGGGVFMGSLGRRVPLRPSTL